MSCKKRQNCRRDRPSVLGDGRVLLGAAAEARGRAAGSHQEQGEAAEELAGTDRVYAHAEGDQEVRQTERGGTDDAREGSAFLL